MEFRATTCLLYKRHIIMLITWKEGERSRIEQRKSNCNKGQYSLGQFSAICVGQKWPVLHTSTSNSHQIHGVWEKGWTYSRGVSAAETDPGNADNSKHSSDHISYSSVASPSLKEDIVPISVFVIICKGVLIKTLKNDPIFVTHTW